MYSKKPLETSFDGRRSLLQEGEAIRRSLGANDAKQAVHDGMRSETLRRAVM